MKNSKLFWIGIGLMILVYILPFLIESATYIISAIGMFITKYKELFTIVAIVFGSLIGSIIGVTSLLLHIGFLNGDILFKDLYPPITELKEEFKNEGYTCFLNVFFIPYLIIAAIVFGIKYIYKKYIVKFNDFLNTLS